jgi:hypothetical protein
LVCLHAQEFFKLYFGDEAEFLMTKFFEMRGELSVSSTPWSDPVGEDAKYDNQTVLRTKIIKMRVQIKGNPFVKEAPTTKNFKLIENSENKIVLKVLNKTNDVPYCDSFAVEEEMLIASLPATKCCVFRVSYCIRWYKSTMMKGMIKSNTDAESEKSANAYKQWIIDNGH